jgi:hypothetical protein
MYAAMRVIVDKSIVDTGNGQKQIRLGKGLIRSACKWKH